MKSYSNKKIYNFKKTHLRKRRTRSTFFRHEKLGGEYTKMKRREFRVICKEILRKKMIGKQIEFPLYKKTMNWDW
ncbi:hypothetical protein [Tenacibaculum sp. 190524A05c]|uniref:hypothetical protein n=1 Tax=Tenacibaculum platacis TaxID=3137852 RepID=UPI0031FB0AC9